MKLVIVSELGGSGITVDDDLPSVAVYPARVSSTDYVDYIDPVEEDSDVVLHRDFDATKRARNAIALPAARLYRKSWWRRLLAWMFSEEINRHCPKCHARVSNDGGLCCWCRDLASIHWTDEEDVARMPMPTDGAPRA